MKYVKKHAVNLYQSMIILYYLILIYSGFGEAIRIS